MKKTYAYYYLSFLFHSELWKGRQKTYITWQEYGRLLKAGMLLPVINGGAGLEVKIRSLLAERGRYTLSFEAGLLNNVSFEEYNMLGNGYDWQTVVCTFLELQSIDLCMLFTLQSNVNNMHKNYLGKLASQSDFYAFCLCRISGKTF